MLSLALPPNAVGRNKMPDGRNTHVASSNTKKAQLLPGTMRYSP